MERDVGTGLVRTLARGGLATVGTFRHGVGPHRDPEEEAFPADTVMVPLAGAWIFHGRRAPEAGHGVVVAGAAGARFRARHSGERPDDRTLFVEITGGGLDAEVRPRAFEREIGPMSAEVGRITAELWHESRTDDVSTGLAVDLLAMRLTLALARTSRHTEVSRVTRDGVDAAREHIEQHLADPIDLATLSRVALLSPFHLARAFRQRVGTSPHRYLMDVRLSAVESMLRDGDLTVTRIADRTGFASLAHLGRRFAERYGMPPSAYRRTFGRGDRTPG